jgi:DNA-binding NtrC family response regulator
LNVVAITLPPLRERKEDLTVLVDHFVDRYCGEVKRPRLAIDSAALELLASHDWPGNVRELQNVIERACVLSPGPAISPSDLPAEVRKPPSTFDEASGEAATPIDPELSLAEATELFRRARIGAALAAVGGNQSAAARQLGLPRSNLSRLMKRLGLR